MLCGLMPHTLLASHDDGRNTEREADMSRIDLQVPFSEKNEAQRLGARWDPRQRVWYVPPGVAPAPLQQWSPRPPTPNIRSPRFFLATTTRDCWRCAASTRVVAIVLPEGHEAFLEEIAEPFSTSCGEYAYIEWIADARHPNLSSSHASARHGGYFSMRTILKRCANALRDSW
jgi:hypothetical protein